MLVHTLPAPSLGLPSRDGAGGKQRPLLAPRLGMHVRPHSRAFSGPAIQVRCRRGTATSSRAAPGHACAPAFPRLLRTCIRAALVCTLTPASSVSHALMTPPHGCAFPAPGSPQRLLTL
eukprot:296813-Chlamydomonas_euryale.AAC.2